MTSAIYILFGVGLVAIMATYFDLFFRTQLWSTISAIISVGVKRGKVSDSNSMAASIKKLKVQDIQAATTKRVNELEHQLSAEVLMVRLLAKRAAKRRASRQSIIRSKTFHRSLGQTLLYPKLILVPLFLVGNMVGKISALASRSHARHDHIEPV